MALWRDVVAPENDPFGEKRQPRNVGNRTGLPESRPSAFHRWHEHQRLRRCDRPRCAVSVTPLLRERLARAAHLPHFYEEFGANTRLVAVRLDELATAQAENLRLPMPSDPRLRKVVDEMMASPADRGSWKVWAQRAAMSERSLERLINREVGPSLRLQTSTNRDTIRHTSCVLLCPGMS